ncbi:hypothetical protein MMC28_004565 [Mycoblastus sanguinarius]|nr:hypothetical protein [Mycoblastus sanguinarius]
MAASGAYNAPRENPDAVPVTAASTAISPGTAMEISTKEAGPVSTYAEFDEESFEKFLKDQAHVANTTDGGEYDWSGLIDFDSDFKNTNIKHHPRTENAPCDSDMSWRTRFSGNDNDEVSAIMQTRQAGSNSQFFDPDSTMIPVPAQTVAQYPYIDQPFYALPQGSIGLAPLMAPSRPYPASSVRVPVKEGSETYAIPPEHNRRTNNSKLLYSDSKDSQHKKTAQAGSEKPTRRPEPVHQLVNRKNPRYSPNTAYTPLNKAPASWDIFKYDQTGELKPSRLYTPAKLNHFLFNHPHHEGLVDRTVSALTLRIGRNPPQSRARYPTQLSHRCRCTACPAANNSITQGQICITLDELSQTNPDHDPYLNAGYLHLFCAQKFLDFDRIVLELDIVCETRKLHKEPRGKNLMRLGTSAEERCVKRFLEASRAGEIVHDPCLSQEDRPYEGSLCHRLAVTKLRETPPSVSDQWAARERVAGYKGSTLMLHKGNLEVEAETRLKTRIHANQNQIIKRPKHPRIYRNGVVDDNGEEDEEYSDGENASERDMPCDKDESPPRYIAPIANVAPRNYVAHTTQMLPARYVAPTPSMLPNRHFAPMANVPPPQYANPTAYMLGNAHQPQQRGMKRSLDNTSESASSLAPEKPKGAFFQDSAASPWPQNELADQIRHQEPEQMEFEKNGHPESPSLFVSPQWTPINKPPQESHLSNAAAISPKTRPFPTLESDFEEGEKEENNTDSEADALEMQRIELELKLLQHKQKIMGKGKKRAREDESGDVIGPVRRRARR